MRDFTDIMRLWPSTEKFASEVGVLLRCARGWRRRNSIPGKYFSATVRAADARGLISVTAQSLSDIAEKRRLEKAVRAARLGGGEGPEQ